MAAAARLWLNPPPAPAAAAADPPHRIASSGSRIQLSSLSSSLPGRPHAERINDTRLHFAGPQSPNSHTLRCRPIRVKSGETEGSPNPNPNPEAPTLDEQTLQEDLETAIQEENYALAAKIRDKLQVIQEDSKSSILAANTRFYNAFKNGNLASMHAIWSKGDHVYVIHPSAGRISGYELVMGSWEIVCGADYEFPIQIDLKNVEVHVRGNMGYVTCMEVVKTRGSSWGKQVATNVFERVDGQWFICIHHASHIDG